MFPVKCPRCELVWYSNEEDAGRVRTCSSCIDELQRQRPFNPVRVDAFLIATVVFLAIDILLISLTGLWPDTVSMVLLVYGAVIGVVGLVGLRRTLGFGHAGDVDWSLARWPLMLALMGLACVLAYFTFVIKPRLNHAAGLGWPHIALIGPEKPS